MICASCLKFAVITLVSLQTKTIAAALAKITASIDDVIEFSKEVVDKFTSIEKEVGIVSSQEQAIRIVMEEQSANSKHVLDAIGVLNDISGKVQESSAEMLSGTAQVTEEARNMSAITQEITGGMNEMASGTDQIIQAVSTVNALTEETQSSISSLAAEVRKFKV